MFVLLWDRICPLNVFRWNCIVFLEDSDDLHKKSSTVSQTIAGAEIIRYDHLLPSLLLKHPARIFHHLFGLIALNDDLKAILILAPLQLAAGCRTRALALDVDRESLSIDEEGLRETLHSEMRTSVFRKSISLSRKGREGRLWSQWEHTGL